MRARIRKPRADINTRFENDSTRREVNFVYPCHGLRAIRIRDWYTRCLRITERYFIRGFGVDFSMKMLGIHLIGFFFQEILNIISTHKSYIYS